MSRARQFCVVFAMVFSAVTLFSQTKPRARDLGVPFDGTPGPNMQSPMSEAWKWDTRL